MTISTDRSKLDLSGMYAAHDSFRRDLERLVRAAKAGPQSFKAVAAGWENFKVQLHIHHQAEDEQLWPRLRQRVSAPEDLQLLEQMQAEHLTIDPLLEEVETAVRGNSHSLTAGVVQLSDHLVKHLVHEEREALPLIDAVLEPGDWRAFTTHIRRVQGIKGAAIYLPWVLDNEHPTEWQRQFYASVPAPVRLVSRLRWQPRYHRRHLWS
jgi:hemerythrin-like domain-containing protein